MRLCTDCGCPDAPHLTGDKPCRCGATAPEPAAHHMDCPALQHSVVPYMVGVHKSELVSTPEHPEGELPRKWRGWRLLRDGRDLFRSKMICRACIERREESEKRQQRLNQRRASLSRQTERSYALIYLSQGG